ncbi:MAG TPA: class I SAM-dependent methyltransferase [Actinomycetota bacterium]|nr:class I SAM-dependent methyltransferase [Actinomycetota bacterium]
MSEYIYDTSQEDEHTRLHALEAVLDPGSIRILETIGVAKTWRCLEVGGGGGSIAQWLSEHAGSVVATDLDTRFLELIPAVGLEIRKHNIVTEPIEEAAFDLVHSRDVLEHIPQREAVLDTMVSALKPGGWLVAEDVDFIGALRAEGFGEVNDLTRMEARLWPTVIRGMRSRGIDPEYGRCLPWRLAARGLVDIAADVRGGLVKAGTRQATLAQLSLRQFQPILIEGGMTENEIEQFVEILNDKAYLGFGPIHVAAWGRKPA